MGSQISAVKQSENHQSGGSDPVYKQKIHEANHTKMGFGPFKILLLFGLSVRPENPENTEKVSYRSSKFNRTFDLKKLPQISFVLQGKWCEGETQRNYEIVVAPRLADSVQGSHRIFFKFLKFSKK